MELAVPAVRGVAIPLTTRREAVCAWTTIPVWLPFASETHVSSASVQAPAHSCNRMCAPSEQERTVGCQLWQSQRAEIEPVGPDFWLFLRPVLSFTRKIR